jgi:hypothetical protein
LTVPGRNRNRVGHIQGNMLDFHHTKNHPIALCEGLRVRVRVMA